MPTVDRNVVGTRNGAALIAIIFFASAIIMKIGLYLTRYIRDPAAVDKVSNILTQLQPLAMVFARLFFEFFILATITVALLR